MTTKAKRLLIGKVARRAGVTADAVRFYERAGLMPRPERTASDYRVYDADAVTRLRFIQKAQALGLSLDEIKRVLRLRDSGRLPCDYVVELAEQHLHGIERELEDLQRFRDSLRTYLRRWRNRPRPDACAAAQFCSLIEQVAVQPKDSHTQTGRRPLARRRA